jgi:NAD(P)-dependent dehydrogenase (short-subunit alcohol dehydrogenase family)
MSYDLSGKTVIVTGGASGIGEAAAVLYAKHGMPGCNIRS